MSKRRIRGRLRKLTHGERERKLSRNFWRRRRLDSPRQVARFERAQEAKQQAAQKVDRVFAARGPRI